MKRLVLVVVVLALGICGLAFAGEQQELQLQLEKALLTLSNAQLQFQVRMADDPAVQSARTGLNELTKEIRKKGYEIQQKPDGSVEIILKKVAAPEPKKEDVKPAEIK
jgi:uncharacterized protein HemX